LYLRWLGSSLNSNSEKIIPLHLPLRMMVSKPGMASGIFLSGLSGLSVLSPPAADWEEVTETVVVVVVVVVTHVVVPGTPSPEISTTFSRGELLTSSKSPELEPPILSFLSALAVIEPTLKTCACASWAICATQWLHQRNASPKDLSTNGLEHKTA